ncbi:TlpA family protein disulfide reductase [Saccharospirillum impatiens]|uniref:TlpA family protein disulfide reductase n=1 Tax=Saccharospirillum impatiens TaxID=169438 RepID=UPI00146E8728|nr:TlpA disulfide reductase family protein [Saccharospirillum impatiens]
MSNRHKRSGSVSGVKRSSFRLTLLSGVVALGVLFSVAPSVLADVSEGDTMPAFRLPTLDGRMLDSTALQGRVVYIDFWASWCTTCRKSFPVLNELHEEFRNQVVFIGLNTDEDPALAERFLQATPVDFLILSDKDQRVVSEFRPQGYPTAYVIDRTGTVQKVEAGFAGKEETRAYLQSLL